MTRLWVTAAARKGLLKTSRLEGCSGNTAKRARAESSFGDYSNPSANLPLVLLQLLISANGLQLVLSEASFHIKVFHNKAFRTFKDIGNRI